jgi:hypothetical protein
MPEIPPVTIRAIAGLWNSPNPFSKVPEGALQTADELVIRANGVLEPRRGFDLSVGGGAGWTKIFAASDSRCLLLPLRGISQIFPAIPSPAANGLIVDGGPQVLTGSPNFDEWPYASDPRVSPQFAVANQTAFVTFQHGPLVQLFGSASYPIPALSTTLRLWPQYSAGLPRCPVPLVSLIAPVGNAVMSATARRTYRVTVAWYDLLGNFHESAPSEPVWVETSGATKTAQITLRWPLGIQCWNSTFGDIGTTLQPFFRVWRGLETAPGVVSNDEMFLVREFVPPAYTFATIGGDFILDPNVTFTVNDVSIDTLLNVPLYTNPQTGDGAGIFGSNRRPPAAAAMAYFKGRMYYGRCSYQQSLTLQIIGTGTGGIAPGDTIAIDGITYTAGGAGLEASGIFNCPTGAGAPASNIETTAKSLVECIRQAYCSSTGPGYDRQIHRKLAAYYASSGVNDYGRILFERPFPVSNGDDPGAAFSVATASAGVRFPGGSTTSSDDYVPGGLSWSKPDEPEAVPDVNFDIVGDANRALLGFSVHRDAMIIYKEDGAYILRDDGGPSPSIDLLDPSVVCLAPASIAVVSNMAYLLATRGVLQVSEQGTELVSFPIWEELDKLCRQSANALAGAYGIAHESDRLYILGVPASANEATCSRQYVLRIPESESPLPKWTRWLLPTTTHGCAVPKSNNLAFADSLGVLYERRNFLVSLNYYDGFRQVGFAPPGSGTVNTVVLAGDQRANVGSGDILQYSPGGLAPGTKIYLPRVIAVAYAAGQTTVTLDQAIPWSGGSLQTFPAIRAHWRFLPITGGEPTMEKQWTYLHAYFSYFDGDWLDTKLDSETVPLSDFAPTYSDPQSTNLGGELQLAFPGSVEGNPSPSTPVGDIPWLRNCKDVILRVDPASTEARGARLGVEMQFAQALASFKLSAVCATIGEVNATGGR